MHGCIARMPACTPAVGGRHAALHQLLSERGTFNRPLSQQGMHAFRAGRTCMTTLRMGVPERRSYSATDLSLPADARTSGSAGLKRSAVTLSLPQA